MVFNRQKTLIHLLKELGGSIGSLDFQKLLFLYTQEWETEPSYEFVPYKLGGFSFTSYSDKRKLIEQGLLADDEHSWTLTDSGFKYIKSHNQPESVPRFARAYSNLRGDALVATAYRRHPWCATRSKMANRVLAGDAKSLAAIEAARPAPGKPGICTIGYEGRTLEGYLNRLLNDGVTLLCDVRRNPLSRKYGFSKGTLSRACDGVGIRYEHVPELGIASTERKTLHSQADYDKLFSSYRMNSLPNANSFLARITSWVNEGYRVALTCFEHAPEQCHRHCVADALAQMNGSEFAPHHL